MPIGGRREKKMTTPSSIAPREVRLVTHRIVDALHEQALRAPARATAHQGLRLTAAYQARMTENPQIEFFWSGRIATEPKHKSIIFA
jgi:hypothetical protein